MTETESAHQTRSGGKPAAELAILETRVYRGANIWSYDKAIHLVVDLGVLEDYPTNTLPGFTEHLLEALPGLREHSCSRGRRGGSAVHEHQRADAVGVPGGEAQRVVPAH